LKSLYFRGFFVLKIFGNLYNQNIDRIRDFEEINKKEAFFKNI